ncbi:MAG: trehalose-phosphatase [Bacteroidota bacterium]
MPGIPHPARPLLFLDYDGTLAPIVDDPAEAWPHPDVPGLLRRLAEQHPVVVVSGRDLATLARFLPGVSVRAAGLHGAEVGLLGETSEPSPELRAVQPYLDRLRESVPEMDGVRVEEKGAAFAVHYRAAPDESAAQRALREWSVDLPEALHAVWGKKVVELRPREVSKGTAVTAIAREHPDRTPVYLGDDTTDEDAFAALHSLRLGTEAEAPVTVKVGEGETVARFRVPDVDAAVDYLRAFAS